MTVFPLNADDLQVDSFPVVSTDPSLASPMKTWEPGCTTPELCPTQTTVVG